MKTMKKGNDVIRVKDTEAEQKKKQGYQYVPKSVWKKQRLTNKQEVKNEPGKSA